MPPVRLSPRFFCDFCGHGLQTASGLTKHLTQNFECARRKALYERNLRTAKTNELTPITDPDLETPIDDWPAPTTSDSDVNQELSPIISEPTAERTDLSVNEGLADDFEPVEYDIYPEEPEATASTSDGGQSSTCQNSELRRLQFTYVNYPGNAGASIGIGTPKFQSFMGGSANPLPNPSAPPTPSSTLRDPELWELARWFMSSGLSARARDEFLKLKIVSNLYIYI